MVKLIPFAVSSLLGCAVVAATALYRLQSVPRDQAGVAYVQNEKGEFVELTSERLHRNASRHPICRSKPKRGPSSEAAAIKASTPAKDKAAAGSARDGLQMKSG